MQLELDVVSNTSPPRAAGVHISIFFSRHSRRCWFQTFTIPATDLMNGDDGMDVCIYSFPRHPSLNKIGQPRGGVESSWLETPPPCVDAQKRRPVMHSLPYRDAHHQAGLSVRRELGRVLGRVQWESMCKPTVVSSKKPYQQAVM